MSNKASASTGVGGITVFMVLSVLLISVFAVLTMTSANADMTLSRKNYTMTQEYYDLDSKATRLICDLESDFMAGGKDYDSIILLAFPEAQNNSGFTDDGSFSLELNIPFGARDFALSAVYSGQNGWTLYKWSLGPSEFGSEEIDIGLPVIQ